VGRPRAASGFFLDICVFVDITSVSCFGGLAQTIRPAITTLNAPTIMAIIWGETRNWLGGEERAMRFGAAEEAVMY
jgi:hypothetical protein